MAVYLLAIPIAIALIALFFFIRMIIQVVRQSRELDTQLADLLEQSQMREKARKRVSDSTNRRPGLPARSILNDFELPNLWGGAVTLSQWKGQRIASIFVRPSCPFSRDLIVELRVIHPNREGSDRQLIFISNGTEAENRELFAGYTADTPILLQVTNEVARLWRVPITPAAYLFDEDLVTEGQIVRGAHEVLPALGFESEGEDVPDPEVWKSETTRFMHQFESILPVLTPRAVAPFPMLAPFLDEELTRRMAENRTILVFSDPSCAPCQELYPELEARFRNFPSGLLLLVGSRGSDEHAHALHSEFDLTFPIFAHPAGELNRAFGTVETPAALLIDKTGFIVSPAVVGSDAILAMIDQAREGGR